MITYTIDTDTNTVYIIEGDEVIVAQDTYPNGDTFDTLEDADNWALAAIEALKPDSLQYAPMGKNIPGEFKPTVADLNAWHERRIKLDPTLEEFRDELIKVENEGA